jgi:hypothetical protein
MNPEEACVSSAEFAHESLERAEHAGPMHSDGMARWTAILIGCLAAGLAISEMLEKQAQNEYLTHHIAVSDTWAFYQAKNIRSAISTNTAMVLKSLPGAPSDREIGKRIEDAEHTAARLESDSRTGDGKRELMERAKQQTVLRDQELHRYHGFELANGLLQIGIVFASVAVVTRVRKLTWAAGSVGGAAAICGILAWIGV